ncbi:hypothetical protein AAE478_002724 [Parahypoxylon ruwenzoriense]
MSNDDPIAYLGLSCPDGGTFHICDNSTVRFIGCCDVDPCADGSGSCPAASLHPAGFDADRYNEIPGQNCVTPSTSLNWFTCVDGPFLGCCRSNPCSQGGSCPSDDLVAARLSDDPDSAAVFLSSSSTTSSTSSTTSATSSPGADPASTSAPATTSTAAPESPDTSGPPVGKIVGGTVGGVAALILIACFLFLYRRRRAAREEHPAARDQMEVSHPPYSPYKDSFASSPTYQHTSPAYSPTPGFPGPTLTNTGRISAISQFHNKDSTTTPPPSWAMLDPRHASYVPTPAPSDYLDRDTGYALQPAQQPRHTGMSTVSELEGSGWARDGEGQGGERGTPYYELESGAAVAPPQS